MQTPPRLTLFGDDAQRRWGEFVAKIMLHPGVPCPNRTQGGCVYCAAEGFTPYYLQPGDDLSAQIAKGKQYLDRLGARRFLASFQMETATARPASTWIPNVLQPLSDPDCVGLVVSTRPDYLDEPALAALKTSLTAFPGKLALIELGLQSARDDSLRWMNRNHSVADFEQAVRLVKRHPRFELGAHLILGIPGETLADMRASVRFVCGLGVQHLKLHHLQVVNGTRLAEMFAETPFALPTVDQYLDWLCELVPLIPAHVILHRLWSNCRPSLLIAPRWELETGHLYRRLFALLEQRKLGQGQLAAS